MPFKQDPPSKVWMLLLELIQRDKAGVIVTKQCLDWMGNRNHPRSNKLLSVYNKSALSSTRRALLG